MTFMVTDSNSINPQLICYTLIVLGVKATSMNVHLLRHLHKCVQQWGPLWAYSCFHFENLNGVLKSLF